MHLILKALSIVMKFPIYIFFQRISTSRELFAVSFGEKPSTLKRKKNYATWLTSF
jgi:hypothetical protein